MALTVVHKRRRLWASALPLLLLLVLTACGAKHHAQPASAKQNEALPAGCALGHSGPTLNPGDGPRNAMAQARALLAAERLGARIESSVIVGAREVREYSLLESEDWLHGTEVRTIYGRGKGASERESFAIACFADSASIAAAPRLEPSWLGDRHRDGAPCAPGIAGPTLQPDDQEELARRDAAEALARAEAVKIYSFLALDGEQVLAWLNDENADPVTLASYLDRARVKERWLDMHGKGPLGCPGVLYVLVCAE